MSAVLWVPEFLPSGHHSAWSDDAGGLQPHPGVLWAALPLCGREPGGVWQVGLRPCSSVRPVQVPLAWAPLLLASGAPAGRGTSKTHWGLKIAPASPHLYPHTHLNPRFSSYSALPEWLTDWYAPLLWWLPPFLYESTRWTVFTRKQQK